MRPQNETSTGLSRGWGKLPWTMQRFVGLAIAEKYKVHQKAPFSKEKFKNFLPRAAPQKCLGPHGNDSLGPTVAVDGPCEDKADSAAAAAAM